jgi:hypothetical protein
MRLMLNRRVMRGYPTTSLKVARERYQAALAKVKALRRGSYLPQNHG